MKKGNLIVISGPSGVGKGTVVKALMQRHDKLRFSVSATTRAIRPGEVDGVNYYYITKERFEQMIANDELLEHARYVDNYYGTPAAPVDRLLEEGYDVILEIEVQGALQVKQRRPEAVLIFIAAPSFDELARSRSSSAWRLRTPNTAPPRRMTMWWSMTTLTKPWTRSLQFSPRND